LWTPAAAVYVLLAIGIALFVVPRSSTMGQAAAYGLAFGLIVYGVYDLTNYATVEKWPAMLVLVDVAWGSLACAAAAVFVWWMASR
jgi:uncharacterized membrane protein